jgi:cytochrome c6
LLSWADLGVYPWLKQPIKKLNFKLLSHFVFEENPLKKLLSVILLAVSFLTLALGSPALAADAALGAKVFSANCAACHMGGNNVVMANKTLKKEALEQFSMYSADAIMTQVTNGKNAMPAFGGRLGADEIANVAAYVLSQADKGWAG